MSVTLRKTLISDRSSTFLYIIYCFLRTRPRLPNRPRHRFCTRRAQRGAPAAPREQRRRRQCRGRHLRLRHRLRPRDRRGVGPGLCIGVRHCHHGRRGGGARLLAGPVRSVSAYCCSTTPALPLCAKTCQSLCLKLHPATPA